MSRVSQEEREELSDHLDNAEHNGEHGVCNWCGADEDVLRKVQTVTMSDLKRNVFKCDECGERTMVYNWGGPTWRAAAALEYDHDPDTGYYHICAGSPA